jgi:TolB protein
MPAGYDLPRFSALLRYALEVFAAMLFTALLRHRLPHVLVWITLGFSATWVQAQTVQLTVSGVGSGQIPIAMAPFVGQEATPANINSIIWADLERSGQFRSVDATGSGLNENSRPDFKLWRQRMADAVVAGSVQATAQGYELRFTLWDSLKGQTLAQETLRVPSANLRYAAHRAADIIYEKLTGEKGIFATRVAYITKSGGQYKLWIADAADGEHAVAALSSREPIISPVFSPKGDELAYVSFEQRKPVVYIHTLSTGQRRIVANFKGSNSAPAWAPDGQSLVVSLSRDGGTQLFRVSRNGGAPQKLTNAGINTEAAFSADGSQIYFTSDRGGAPQIYRMSADGGAATRVTFGSAQALSPALSPDGKWLAYIGRESGGYKLRVMDLANGSSRVLTSTTEDERPSFAPNSRLIVYATRQGGTELLMNTTLDGRVQTRLLASRGDIREPSWGK